MSSVESRLAGNGRLLVRYSGTEPLLRVMLEGQDEAEIRQLGRRKSSTRSSSTSARAKSEVRIRILDCRDQALRQRQQGRDGPELARRQRAVGARGRAACASRPARPGSPCIRAPTRGTSRPPTCARSPRILARTRRPASNTTSKAIRGRICSSWCTTVRPTQCTLVPVQPGEITSQAGWSADTPRDARSRGVVEDLQRAGIRVSLFVDPEEAPIRWAADVGADRVELYTEPFARAFERGERRGQRVVRDLRARRGARACARPRRQRRPRPRPRQPRAVPRAAAPRRGVDRPRARSATRCSSALLRASASTSSVLVTLACNAQRPTPNSQTARSLGARTWSWGWELGVGDLS